MTIEDKSLETVNEEKLREENEERDLTEPSKPELVNDYDPERRKLAMEYTRASRTYSLKLLILSLVVSVLILLSKITVMLNDFIVKNISADPVIVVGLFFTIGFTLLSMIELPFSFYSHIRFGKKYGLSKLNNRQWFFRHLKGEVLGFILTFIIFEGFYWILRVVTSTWWVWATIIMILFSIVLSALVPVLILPRFYKFESLENTHPELTKELLDLANQAGFKAKNVFNWKLGAVATVGNAALMGLGSTRRIVISDTMLDQYTSEEIKWILAHELGHHVHHDLWKRIVTGTISTLIMFYITNISFLQLSTILDYPSDISSVATLPVIGLSFWMVSEVLINVPSLWLSRRDEKSADSYACKIIPDKLVVQSLFMKMADQNLADISPPWWERIFYLSHPPIETRIADSIKQIEKYSTLI